MSTFKLTWAIGVGALVAAGLAASGCDAPNIVPTSPPGIDYHQVQPQPKESDDDKPQAIGELDRSATKKATPLPDLVPAPPTATGEVKTTRAGVKYETLKEGTGEVVRAGQVVRFRYTGKLEDGKTFDSSSKAGTEFTIGVGHLILGWDEAVPGMKVGETRKLTVPPSAGYGAQGKPPRIPQNATLVFEIELLSAKEQ